ncbi:hypothetical protein [Kribbella sp. DT2]|uniref:hypothetical protein n=1 Tax=Kribbella sp. DT2 TaxID=3393427 RepID=UPI003CF4C9F3
MRFVRFLLGLLLALLGLAVAVVGAFTAFWLVGPDDTVYAGEQTLTSKGLAIASTPQLLDRHGPTLHVKAHSADGSPVFVGVARDLDVASYLKNTAYTSLAQVEYPIALTTQERKGTAGPLTAPNTLDWWSTKASGPGTQSIAWPIEDGPYDVVIMRADGKEKLDVRADFGIELNGAFLAGLGILVVGLLLLAGGVVLLIPRRRSKTPPASQPVATEVPADQPHVGAGPMRRTALPPTARRMVGVPMVLSVVLVSGCSVIPATDTVDSLTRPAITGDSATAVIKRYNAVNNAANKARDDKLIATIESGPLLRASQAGYTIGRATDKAGKKVDGPFSYTSPKIGAPSYGGYPMSFVTSSGLSSSKDHLHLGMWERESAGSPWIQTFSTAPRTTAKIPDLTGLRVATAADSAKLVAAPQAAATALAQYLTAGAKAPQAGRFTPSPEVNAVLADVAKSKQPISNNAKAIRKVAATVTVPNPPATFIAASGEALVLTTLSSAYLLEAGAGYTFSWGNSPQSAFSAAQYENALTSTTLYQVALAVPVKGGGKIRVLGLDTQLVDAGGY